ncbi:CRISPR-associated endonuclease Cas2 [Candidatus Giovannonibacteria bacterium RIFCSPHIGHO2_12_44_12]|uniref:CRISPR-associated endonuclease Cas2 n=3 Tax=Candidatus Giovannoniibacteriota TaxID=1752738 RepID=A0A1F5X1V9_9BACT|nr:MAG: Transcriptional regulator, PaaX family [Candidatus Giovannonibacteria bacterium GW2011_GWC2_44_8]KKU03737.1 MAG: Transcriptional regulator, PaaX family [Candidatus Giovannonibacteria bacterium GW2011_GWA2_45_21]OGF81884.1 MAG: CRISPR-associated endonuclease Cas2 [Candidatus Giovannonibacteria bacterium RIFCSPHIGHO2_12_44_12]
MPRYAKLSGQILSLMASGLLLGFSRDKGTRKELLEECDRVWLSMDRNQLFHLIRILKLNGFIKIIEKDKKSIAEITNKGKLRIRRAMLDKLLINIPKRWDRKWRIVIFDIPEEKRRLRDALRHRLKILGYFEFQKSVFVFPYRSESEINILVNYFKLHENVRYMEATLSYDSDLRRHFAL